MVWTTLPPNSVDKDSIIDEALMDSGIKNNDDDHETRILDLEAAGTGGGGDSGAFAEILGGVETNEGVVWKKKFSVIGTQLSGLERADFFGDDAKERFIFDEGKDHLWDVGNSDNLFAGTYLTISDNGKVSFKLKKGENFFGLGIQTSAGFTDSITVLIDGQSLTSQSIVDEDGAARANTFSAITTTNAYGTMFYFFGLDGEEHLISIENTATNAGAFNFESIEVGFRTVSAAIDDKIKVSAGRASVLGTEITVPESEETFSKASGYGKTSSLVADTAGVVSVIEGEEPAQTQLRAEVDHTFSSGVTSLECKNTYFFPANGIGLVTFPNGHNHVFSWTSKDEATIQAHSLDGVIWKTEPNEDFTPLNNFNGATGEATGDANINYIATAPIIISASNNKIDFQITVNGSQTSHTATIANGGYSGDDLLPLSAAINTAMQAAKPINGKYFATWNNESQLWVLGVKSHEVSEIQYLINTGASGSANVMLALGYADADLTGSLSYQATTETIHKACRVLDFDSKFMDAVDPRIKYSWSGDIALDDEIRDAQDRLGLGPIRSVIATDTSLITVYPDKDCCGLQVTFLTKNTAEMIVVQADNLQSVYLLNPSAHAIDVTVPLRARLMSSFVTFPKGSKIVKILPKSEAQFSIATGTNIYFVGCRQIFTRPPVDKLSTSQAILKSFEIAPLQLYETPYGHNGGTLYSPTATDNVDAIAETGSWAGATVNDSWNGAVRTTSALGAYVDIDFTLTGNGGGIRIIGNGTNGYSSKTALFLNTQASGITEANDRIQNENHQFGTTTNFREYSVHSLLGLPAGSYVARIKNEVSGEALQYQGFAIIDSDQPERNKNTVSDITGTGQGVTYPINTIATSVERDQNDRVPDYLFRSGWKEGETSKTHSKTGLISGQWSNLDETNPLIEEHELYWGGRLQMGASTGEQVAAFDFAKSFCVKIGQRQDFTTTVTTFLDGVQALNTFSTRVAVKGGSSGLAGQLGYGYLFSKFHDLDCSFSAGDVFTIADTRGIRVDQEVLLYDGTNFESASILSLVTNTSFTVKKARTTVVDANVTDVYFYGFHTIKFQIDNANPTFFSSIEYEPLTIQPSRAKERYTKSTKFETKSITFEDVSTGDDLYFPVHSDGVAGDWRTSEISVVEKSAASTFEIPRDLKGIVISAGTLNIKVTSRREVATETELI